MNQELLVKTLRKMSDVCQELYELGSNDVIMDEHHKTEWLVLDKVIRMIEDPEHLKRLARIYKEEMK